MTWLIDGKPPTLFGFLRKHGVPLPTSRAQQDPLWRGGEYSLLAKYVIANLGRNDAFWRGKVLTAPVIEESIVGNLEERLLRFLADPGREWELLQDKGIASEFGSQVEERYGNTSGLAEEPEKWAYEFVVSLVLLEIYESTGESDEFPFCGRLPEQKYRPNQREFLRRWMRDRYYIDTYRRWALDVDRELHLTDWAQKQGGRPQALLSLARGRWKRFVAGLEEQGSSRENLQLYLLSYRSQGIEESKGFWAKATGDLPGWSLTVELIDSVQSVNRAINQLSSVTEASALVREYLEDWHRIDYTHWRLLSAARRHEEMELLAVTADRFYSRYLDLAGRAFYESIRDTGQWPPRNCKGVTEIVQELYSQEGGPKAVIVVDALRFDLAQALREKLDQGKLEAVIAAVPSETYVGMTSLVPNANVKLKLEGSKPLVMLISA